MMRSGYRAIVVVLAMILATYVPAHAQAVNPPPITLANVSDVRELRQLGDGTLYGTAWSPDGHWIALGSMLGVWIYDTQARQQDDGEKRPERRLLPEVSGVVYATAFSPDGQTLIAADDQQRLYRWNTNDWKAIDKPFTIPSEKKLLIQDISYSPDGKILLLVTGGESRPAVHLLDANTLEELNLITDPGHLNTINTVELNANGSQALVGTNEGRYWLYDLSDNPARSIRVFFQTSAYASFVSTYSPDHKAIYAVTQDALRVWELNGRFTTVRFLNDQRIFSAAIASDKSRVAVAVRGANSIEIVSYSLPDGNEIGRFAVASRSILQLNYSADGKRLLISTQSSGLQVYDLEIGLQTVSYPYYAIYVVSQAFSPDAKILAVATTTGEILLWSIPAGTYLGSLDPEAEFVGKLLFSPDGKTLAVNTYRDAPTLAARQQRITFFDLESRTITARTDIHKSNVFSMRFVTDGRFSLIAGGYVLVTSDIAGNAYRWDATTGQLLDSYKYGGTNPYLNAVFFADGDRFFFSPTTLGLKLASLTNKKEMSSLIPSESNFSSLIISPREDYFAFRSNNNTISVFNINGTEQARTPMMSFVYSLLFTPDESLLVSTDLSPKLQFWNWQSKTVAHSLTPSRVFNNSALTQNTDGSLIAAGSQYGTVMIFGVKDGNK